MRCSALLLTGQPAYLQGASERWKEIAICDVLIAMCSYVVLTSSSPSRRVTKPSVRIVRIEVIRVVRVAVALLRGSWKTESRAKSAKIPNELERRGEELTVESRRRALLKVGFFLLLFLLLVSWTSSWRIDSSTFSRWLLLHKWKVSELLREWTTARRTSSSSSSSSFSPSEGPSICSEVRRS